jgi:lysophospholipase L1-like esterase
MKKLLFLGVILILLASKCQKGVTKDTFNAQKNPIDTIVHRNALKEMYATLEKLTSSNDSIFSIVHIGDSHVEIGQFSGEIKRQLEKKYGKSEDAWMHPYQFFNKQSQKVFPIDTLGTWKRATIKYPNETKLLGITGLGFYLGSEIGSLKFTSNTFYPEITKVSLLHFYDGNPLPLKIHKGKIHTQVISKNTAITEITFSSTEKEYILEFTKTDDLLIYAIKLNSHPTRGISYHKFGVAGSTIKQFVNNTPLFMEQFRALKPNLLIVSLGTNDSYIDTLNEQKLVHEVRMFTEKLSRYSSKTAVLFTTAPDTKYDDRRPERLTETNRIIRTIAMENPTIALWDLHQIMGGDGSVDDWIKKNYMIFDHLHFTTAGYKLQGELFMEAFWK